jgi:hypothetical protein
VEQIVSIIAKEYNNEYKIKIEMNDNKKYTFVFEFAFECLNWLRGLRKSIQIQEEILRSNFGLIKYNISILYKQYEAKELKLIFEVVDALYNNLVLKLGIDEFLGKFISVIREINFFCDAFFAFKPFIANFFEIIIKRIHMAMRTRICEFWNIRYKDMNPGEILSFGKHANTYRETMSHWGLVDEKFVIYNTPVIRTFCSQIFDSSREIMFNVVEEAMFKFRKEKNIFRNDSTKILEAHMNIVFENFNQFPTAETARHLAILVANMVSIVQMNIIIQIQSKSRNIENEVLTSLTNNSFEGLIRNFVKKIHFKTKSELSLKEIRELINYNYLLRNNERLSTVCVSRLIQRILLEIEDLFDSQRKDLLYFRMDKLLCQVDLLYRDIVFGFQDEFEKYNLVEQFGNKIIKLYFNKLISYLPFISHENYKLIIAKIETDRIKLQAFFRPLVSNELDPMIKMLKHCEEFFSTNDIELMRIIMFKIIAYFGIEYAKENHIEQIFKAKIYLSEKQIGKFIKEFRVYYEEHLSRENKGNVIGEQSEKVLSRYKLKRIAQKFKKLVQKKMKKQFETNLNAYKSNTEMLLYKSFVIGDIYKFKAECKMIKFPESIEDLEIEAFIENYVNKGSM